MSIEGFLDGVDPLQIRGWAHDRSRPGETVTVEIMLGDEVIAEGPASLYREDLEAEGLGDGCCAFVFNLERKLSEADIEKVSARAAAVDGARVALRRFSQDRLAKPLSPQRRPIELPVPCIDETQRPVFILGAARSGTSAITQALLKLGVFEGNEEGHMLDLLAHLAVALGKFYRLKNDELSGDRNTTIARVPAAFYEERLDAMIVDATRRLFLGSRWIDKTPNSDMVHLAPRLKRIWPQSRFIFMRRRFLENVASRSRKFPEYSFERNASEWATAMEAWLQVRPRLRGAAVEIDQKFLSEKPELAGKLLATFLSLSETEETRLAQALRYDRPERTSTTPLKDYDLAQTGWDAEEKGCFARYCEKLMVAFGYSTDAAYYLPGFAATGFVRV